MPPPDKSRSQMLQSVFDNLDTSAIDMVASTMTTNWRRIEIQYAPLIGSSSVKLIFRSSVKLQHRVIAEGVETEEQYRYLRMHQCGEGQGFFFIQPLTADHFGELLESSRLASAPVEKH